MVLYESVNVRVVLARIRRGSENAKRIAKQISASREMSGIVYPYGKERNRIVATPRKSGVGEKESCSLRVPGHPGV
jgi:hypothetical protein